MFQRLEQHFAETTHAPFEYCVIDEAQDIGVAELRFPHGSWRRPTRKPVLRRRSRPTHFPSAVLLARPLGVDVRGRSHTLRINYRTSHQIRQQADRLLPPELADVDGIAERRGGTVSAFNGPEPCISVYGSEDEEATAVAEWLTARRQDGYAPHEIALFVRSEAELPRAQESVSLAGLSATVLDGRSDGAPGSGCYGNDASRQRAGIPEPWRS